MKIRADFDEPALVHTGSMGWVASPMEGVERRMLDRIGGEVARATSIVRYAEASHFPEHTHSGGEEFIVLEGVFQDEHGDYPAGTYVRNPVGTHHIPRSEPGCTIFVKLWQFDPDDQDQLSLDLEALTLADDPARKGVRHAVLGDRRYEHVSLEHWEVGAAHSLMGEGGFEILVLSGSLDLDGETYARHDWLRFPSGASAQLKAGPDGARIWIKRGHLDNVAIPGS